MSQCHYCSRWSLLPRGPGKGSNVPVYLPRLSVSTILTTVGNTLMQNFQFHGWGAATGYRLLFQLTSGGGSRPWRPSRAAHSSGPGSAPRASPAHHGAQHLDIYAVSTRYLPSRTSWRGSRWSCCCLRSPRRWARWRAASPSWSGACTCGPHSETSRC